MRDGEDKMKVTGRDQRRRRVGLEGGGRREVGGGEETQTQCISADVFHKKSRMVPVKLKELALQKFRE
jgi:hypothetical protein